MSDETPPRRRGFITGNYYSPLDRRTKKIAFLAGLCEGRTIADASAMVRVPFRTMYSWRREDPAFRKAWDAARKQAQLAQAHYPLPPVQPPEEPTPEIRVRSFAEPEARDD